MDDVSKNVLTLPIIEGDCNKSLFKQYCGEGRVQLLYIGKYPNKGNKFNLGHTSNKCKYLKNEQAPLKHNAFDIYVIVLYIFTIIHNYSFYKR